MLSLIASGNIHSFYVSGYWKNLCKLVRKKQKNRCYDCMHKSPARITRGVVVHHVHPLRERPDLALSEFDELGKPNLICLCDSCHWDRHHKRKQIQIPERW